MGCRLQNLYYILEGFLKTNVPLIGWNQAGLIPFLGVDDIGIYVLIPQLVRFFNISLEQAINLFFYTLLSGSFLLGLCGFFLIYKTMLTRVIVIVWLGLLASFIMHYNIGDVYLAYCSAHLAIIPLFLYFIKRNDSYALAFYLFFTGIVCGALHYVRSFSSLGVLVFILCILITKKNNNYSKKLILLSCLIMGMLCPFLYFKNVIKSYEKYAQQQFRSFTEFPTVHPFWHNVYLGFGFLNFENTSKIQMNDEYACTKVQETDPSLSIATITPYESILKDEVISLCKTRPMYVLFTIFAKLGILFLYLLLFANIGLLMAFFRPKNWSLECTFYLAGMTNMIAPLITAPYYWYSLGFITIATLYGIVSCNEALVNIQHFIRMPLLKKKSILTS